MCNFTPRGDVIDEELLVGSAVPEGCEDHGLVLVEPKDVRLTAVVEEGAGDTSRSQSPTPSFSLFLWLPECNMLMSWPVIYGGGL